MSKLCNPLNAEQIQEFNENVISDEFLESCRNAGELFRKKRRINKMNNTKLPCSLDDTTELRKMILENPDLPLVVFAGEDANDGEWGYTQAYCRCCVDSLTLYNDHWCDEDDYEERLANDLADEEEYKDLSDAEYEEMIKQKVAETEFVKAIIVYVG